MNEKFRDRQGSQSMAGYRLPESPVDTIANAISRVRSREWLSGGYGSDANILADEVERLRSELVGVKLFSNLQAEAIKDEVIVIGEPYREADWKETAAKAILGEPNPPYPVVPKRPRLIRNAAHCRTCNTTIESKSRHSLVVCGCPQDSSTGIFVDGGLAYSRRGAGVNADYFDLCEYEGDKK